ncbi:MAG TPA: helix-turn-helix transcriptional regulator [Streptosporangiaceae bacterium]|nr:helix-turn-helix transcriptional regulator [Streptosporangiaceae bacterium]
MRHRRLAAELRRLRDAAGLTQEEVSERTGKDRSTLYRLESAQQRPQRSTLIQLLDLYGASPDRRAELLGLLREAGQRGWMQPHRSDLPDIYSDYISFESEARSVSNYESLFIPGLLQTEDYARAVIRGTLPHATTEQVETRVTARMERQALLVGDNSLQLWAIMDEAAVRRVVGGPTVMREQLARLREAAALPHVTVQIIPYAAGAHPGMPGSFIVLEFPDPADQSLVYIDSMAGDLFLEDDLEIRPYILMFEHLRAAAMRPDESLTLLAAIAGELGKGGAG